MPSDYRFSPVLFARSAGLLLALTGLLVVVLALAVGFLDLDPAVLGVAVVAAAVVGVGIAVVLSRRRLPIVRLDEVGYRVRFLRGAGVPQARWTDVEDVVATTVGRERCVVLRLRDGRATTVPVRVLAADPDAFVRDLQRHLNRGHGYRRIR